MAGVHRGAAVAIGAIRLINPILPTRSRAQRCISRPEANSKSIGLLAVMSWEDGVLTYKSRNYPASFSENSVANQATFVVSGGGGELMKGRF
jgi:hypothetical protein